MTHFGTSLENILNTQNGISGLKDLLSAVLIAYFGGVLASLTPCVYPMIPITVGVVGGLGKDEKGKRPWRSVLFRCFAYFHGVVIVYSFLGVIAGLTGQIFGSLTNTHGWYLTLGVVMMFAALMMLDIIRFDPMLWFENIRRKLGGKRSPKIDTAKKEMTLLGAFSLGVASGFVAAPCTTPILTAVLAYIANTRSVGMGFLLMFSFASGLSTLLLLIAVFTGALKIMPRSGNWLNIVKLVSGLMLLGFAAYLFYQAGAAGGV